MPPPIAVLQLMARQRPLCFPFFFSGGRRGVQHVIIIMGFMCVYILFLSLQRPQEYVDRDTQAFGRLVNYTGN